MLPIPDEIGEWDSLVTGEHLWHALWLFGLIEDQAVTRLGNLWMPDGRIENDYYIPDDEDTSIEVTLFNPPKVDARPRWSAT
jgi:hypothetical protein